MELAEFIRDIPDFPKKGVLFKDITTLLNDSLAFRKSVDSLAECVAGRKIDVIVAAESRGFIFAGALAYKLGCAFVPVRKPGKLPGTVHSVSYDLEYGTDTLEMHTDAFKEGSNVMILDDVLATGGTTSAMVELVKKLKGNVLCVAFLIELEFLHGREKLSGLNVHSLIKY
jgi:adenine phosphoribosyltransferase